MVAAALFIFYSSLKLIGDTLDSKYRLVRLIGQGGMGSVYEAQHAGTLRRVAVKVISGDAPRKKNSPVVSRFQREAKAAGSIDTQHIVQVLDAGTDPHTGAPYLVMEYLEGEDVQRLIERVGPLPPSTALKIVAQACIGLQKAHAARVMHRDIKPANLFLSRRGEGEIVVKILDFGIAKIKPDGEQGAETTGLTRSGGLIGSPRYMSPEQARGIKEIDFRTDIWSLGVVLYHALTGRTPHADIDAFGDLIIAICSAVPPSVQSFAPWVPRDVAAIVHGALQQDIQSRFPSALAMLDALKRLLPDGFVLREEMLIPIEAAERAVAEATEQVLVEKKEREASPSVSRLEASPPESRARALLAISAALVLGFSAVAILYKAMAANYLAPTDSEDEFKREHQPGEARLADRKREAHDHFEKGQKLAEEGSWEPALSEFLASRQLYPTRSATVSAAMCLKKLKRVDEAFDLLEPLIKKDDLLPSVNDKVVLP